MEGESTRESDHVRRIAAPIQEAQMWMKLVGVLAIIYGLFSAITIIGIVVAWLPIWMGTLLFGAAARAETAYMSGDEGALVEALGKIRTYFTIMGIVAMMGLLMMIAMFFFGFLGAMAGALL